MAKRRTMPPTPGPPQVSPHEGLALIQTLIDRAYRLLQSHISGDDYESWQLLAQNFLEKVFGVNSPNVSTIMDAGKVWFLPPDADEYWFQRHYTSSLKTQAVKLGSLLEVLLIEIQLSAGQVPAASSPISGHHIFLVHGHDERVLHEIARFLEKLRQKIIILREQPNEGRTIIEKFEEYADVGFAIVLLTADDRGGSLKVPFDEQKLRARQNVIFELGYFIGRLGRNRVSGLYTPNVEIPSDYSGVLYIQLDEHGAWRMALAKELKAAGFPVDMNLAI